MDRNTAKEIINSHGVIEVFYHGEPVWNEQVKTNDQAEISLLTTNERREVPVRELCYDDSIEI